MPTANESVRRYYLVDWDGCVLILFRARFSWLCLLLFFTRALISPSGFRLYSYERIAQSFVYEDCTNRRRRNQIDTCLQSQEWERWSEKNERDEEEDTCLQSQEWERWSQKNERDTVRYSQRQPVMRRRIHAYSQRRTKIWYCQSHKYKIFILVLASNRLK